MSEVSNNYLDYVYGEQHAEDLERARQSLFLSDMGAFLASFVAFDVAGAGSRMPKWQAGRIGGTKNVKRTRLDVDAHLLQMDCNSFRRKYRMNRDSFYKLLDILEPHIAGTGKNRATPGGIPNGPITKASRLSMAIRYCAGGDPMDIADHHGVSTDEVPRSVWKIVDAIHKAPQLNIEFPLTHEAQKDVADGFSEKSKLNIDCCVGAIDIILIWIHKPSKCDVEVIQFGPANFFVDAKRSSV